jgi:hypothetical protein
LHFSITITLPSAADTTIFFLEGVFLFGSLKNCKINNEIIQRGIDHKEHILNAKADIAIDAIRNDQPSLAIIG